MGKTPLKERFFLKISIDWEESIRTIKMSTDSRQLMKLYEGESFANYVQKIKTAITEHINSETESYILEVNPDDYVLHLVDKFSINTPEIHTDNKYIDKVEREISSSTSSSHKRVRYEFIVYHLPFTGAIHILSLRPNPTLVVDVEIIVDFKQQCILIEILNTRNDIKQIQREYNQSIKYILSNYPGLRSSCESFNHELPQLVKNILETKRQQILKSNDLLHSLGIPIKKKDHVPETFSIPRPKLRQKISIRPNVLDNNFKPEPSLDDKSYYEILKIINDVGKNFERLPSTYKGKNEETLRDHILLILDPNFEYGSASGETFNKIGKTDICIRYDSNVVFIAECKYWKGEKVFLNTISQLLGYLTWRNSKVAVINFVQNREFSDVLDKAESLAKTHPNFLKELNRSDETWFNYKFHLDGDRNRIIDLAVLCFHLPN
jgi:hypothetical protein